jgi:hypothetical protein
MSARNEFKKKEKTEPVSMLWKRISTFKEKKEKSALTIKTSGHEFTVYKGINRYKGIGVKTCRLIIRNRNLKVACGERYLGRFWIRINFSCWTRIRIQEGKNDPQKKKKVKKFHVLNGWMFSFEG